MLSIREIKTSELELLLELYTQLHNNPMPAINLKLETLWNEIMADKNHHIIGGFAEGKLVCSCVIVIVPNLTHEQRPYALIENVITHDIYRNKGYGTAVLKYAKDLAEKENCYKIMLMTGSKKEETIKFYERAGFNKNDKTAFIQWL